jgi:DNA repair protein RadC
MIFKIAFEQNATSIVLVHNHPSGKVRPSEADIKITNEIIVAGKQLDILVRDHIIIAQNDFYSFADNEILR